MMTISQVASLTGISVRTLQYYDEIGLFKPSQITDSGYRLYDEAALDQLQQILFFKELDFKLSEIRQIMQQSDYNKTAAFQKQKELLCMKRKRLDSLISLLERLEKGETCMSFKEFDLSEYIHALEQFKIEKTDEVIAHWGSIEKFDHFIQKIREDEPHLAQIAIKQYGSVEKYTEAMKNNLEHFSELMTYYNALNKDEILQKNDELHRRLTADLTRDPGSADIQKIVSELMTFSLQTNPDIIDMGEGYWNMVIDAFSNEKNYDITDSKYGVGASKFIAEALKLYFAHQE